MSTPFLVPTLNLAAAERALCVEALDRAGSIVEAAALLGCTRHALLRRVIKHRIMWPREHTPGMKVSAGPSLTGGWVVVEDPTGGAPL